MPVHASGSRPLPDCPLVVAYGLGVNSTAMLVEFARLDIRPDLVLFADTGLEGHHRRMAAANAVLLLIIVTLMVAAILRVVDVRKQLAT